MSDVKCRFLIFPYIIIYDHKSIEDNLTAMAAKGWRIESIGAFLWKFEMPRITEEILYSYKNKNKLTK